MSRLEVFVKLLDSPFDLHGTGYCASFNFRRTTRAVTRLYDQAFQTCGIRSTQFTMLVSIAKTQPCSISALASLLVMDTTTVTRNLNLLKRKGLLTVSERVTKRQRFVSLTSAGETLLADSLPAWRLAQDRFVRSLGSEYWLNFRSELERLSQVIVGLAEPPASGSHPSLQ
jgi:DNA-binding MarR family transcriptional regulator